MSKTITRPLTRETPDRDASYNETLMIRIEPGSKLLTIWQKGRRRKMRVRYADIFRQALLAQARRF